MQPPENMNPRWFYWLRSRNMQDGESWEFIVWIQERWSEWGKVYKKNLEFKTDQDHKDFDQWLDKSTMPHDLPPLS